MNRRYNYGHHDADELGRIAHEGTLGARQSAIAELVKRARADNAVAVENLERLLANAVAAEQRALRLVDELQQKLSNVRDALG